MPELELIELSEIYEKRGLTPELAKEVAAQLTAHNALESHARDELGINEKAVVRISIWGTFAMGISALVGYIFGVNI
jgi:VIT1/CCC1 family predicted Fe2+/Mn2+ transporter